MTFFCFLASMLNMKVMVRIKCMIKDKVSTTTKKTFKRQKDIKQIIMVDVH